MILYSCIENNQKEFLPRNFYMLFCKVKKVAKCQILLEFALKKGCPHNVKIRSKLKNNN